MSQRAITENYFHHRLSVLRRCWHVITLVLKACACGASFPRCYHPCHYCTTPWWSQVTPVTTLLIKHCQWWEKYFAPVWEKYFWCVHPRIELLQLAWFIGCSAVVMNNTNYGYLTRNVARANIREWIKPSETLLLSAPAPSQVVQPPPPLLDSALVQIFCWLIW